MDIDQIQKNQVQNGCNIANGVVLINTKHSYKGGGFNCVPESYGSEDFTDKPES